MASAGGGTKTMLFAVVAVAVVAILLGAFLAVPLIGPASTSSTTSVMDGVVTGYVTAGPSQPVCSTGQSCIVNMSEYSLVFTPQCGGHVACIVSTAPLSASGHYSALLPPGIYTVSGLYPSCPWMGCTTAFPKTVTVEGGVQAVLDIQIDTGIR